MSLDRFCRNWFKFSINIYEKCNNEYAEVCSSFFDMDNFQWQNLVSKFYCFIDNWITGTGK